MHAPLSMRSSYTFFRSTGGGTHTAQKQSTSDWLTAAQPPSSSALHTTHCSCSLGNNPHPYPTHHLNPLHTWEQVSLRGHCNWKRRCTTLKQDRYDGVFSLGKKASCLNEVARQATWHSGHRGESILKPGSSKKTWATPSSQNKYTEKFISLTGEYVHEIKLLHWERRKLRNR